MVVVTVWDAVVIDARDAGYPCSGTSIPTDEVACGNLW